MARRIPDSVGLPALEAALTDDPSRDEVATAVRYTLQLMAERFPGNAVEVRVPPFGAVQCVEGPRHTRGTPPNVVEARPSAWLAVATGAQSWSDAVSGGQITASGVRADLSAFLPVLRRASENPRGSGPGK